MRRALAVSSNVYFYEIGGGFEKREGLGIERIAKYAKKFGLGSKTGIDVDEEEKGLIPMPEIKLKNPIDKIWRIGDTYNASIGQGAWQVTPVQMARVAGAVATGGKLLSPCLAKSCENYGVSTSIDILQKHFKVVKEGMRMAVTGGTAKALNIPEVKIAAKTGTAEIGSKYVNSWIIGFAPYDEPKVAFAIVMEKGPRENLVGALYVARALFDWMAINKPEYLGL
jgi:penicillin-binding protein 2